MDLILQKWQISVHSFCECGWLCQVEKVCQLQDDFAIRFSQRRQKCWGKGWRRNRRRLLWCTGIPLFFAVLVTILLAFRNQGSMWKMFHYQPHNQGLWQVILSVSWAETYPQTCGCSCTCVVQRATYEARLRALKKGPAQKDFQGSKPETFGELDKTNKNDIFPDEEALICPTSKSTLYNKKTNKLQ